MALMPASSWSAISSEGAERDVAIYHRAGVTSRRTESGPAAAGPPSQSVRLAAVPHIEREKRASKVSEVLIAPMPLCETVEAATASSIAVRSTPPTRVRSRRVAVETSRICSIQTHVPGV